MTIEVLSLDKIKDRVGQELGVSDWLEIDQERVNAFADCTLDHQWIHVDEEAAAKGPFGKTIAHGNLTFSLTTHFALNYALVPEGAMMVINYGANKVRFINPVPVGSRVRDRIVLSDILEKDGGRILVTTTHTIEIEGQSRPACVADLLTMFFMS